MKINNDDLKKLYKLYIIETTPPSRKKCPPIIEIINLFRSKLSERQEILIIDHVSSCYYCLQEFEFILKTLRIDKKLNTDVGNLLRKEKCSLLTPKNAVKKDIHGRKGIITFFPRISRKYAFLFVITILSISIIITMFLLKYSKKIEFRGNYPKSVKLIEPLKKKYSKSLLKFRWLEIKGSEYYIVELFDEALRPIWTSNKIYINSTALPKRIVDILTKNKKYFWILSAYFPDGEKIESRIEYFILTE